MNTAETAKFNMIQQQLRPWEIIDDQVLTVLDDIARADFVAQSYQGLAYADCQIPVCTGVKMLPPTIEGRLLQALAINPDDHILEIGTGSGFITACLAKLGAQVLSIDVNDDALQLAQGNINKYGLNNIELQHLNALNVDYDQSFDVIAVGGSVSEVPEQLKQALSIEGRMFIVCGKSPVMQALLITRVSETEWVTDSLFETDLPALITG